MINIQKEKEFNYAEDVCSSEDFIIYDNEKSIGRIYNKDFIDTLYYVRLFENIENMYNLLDRLYNDNEHITNIEIKNLLDKIGIKKSDEVLSNEYYEEIDKYKRKNDEEFDKKYNEFYGVEEGKNE